MEKEKIFLPFLAILMMLSSVGMKAQGTLFEDAFEATENMRVGWNLGNTLDCHSGDTLNMWIEHWTSRNPGDYEKAWGQPVTTKALIKMFKDAGFNAIRVPVTWYPHMEAKFSFSSSSNSYWYPSRDDIGTKVKSNWMKRVKEIVAYIISQDMYCILNIHHDTGAANTTWLEASEEGYAKSKERFEELWRQIAEEFKGYGEKLLFEAYNEMLDEYDSWCFASYATPAKYNATVAASAYNAINAYAQSFVDVVRSTGGNNSQRNLIVSTYGACSGSGTWNAHLKDPLKNMNLPNDNAEGRHIIFEVHSYPNISNLTNAKNEVKDMMKALQTNLISKGAPVIIGEWGTFNLEEDYKNNRTNMAAFAKDFVEQAKEYGITTFYWMGLSDGADRSSLKWTQPEIKDAIITGFYGEGGFDTGLFPFLKEGTCNEEPYYDILGRPVFNPGAGIYIRKGKKVVLK
ncbi:MAG: glycoside hydrolase family 5 protein [Bacteroidaceae bacterium]|nr:glycoside hydrolase family 5 protein [Bacteroidaceae bacterium]